MFKHGQHDNIIRLADGANIPLDEDNTDYKTYLQWVTDGGVTEAADPEPTPAELLTQARSDIVSLVSSLDRYAKLNRVLMLLILDEFNAHADKINSILTAIDTGATLAAVKTNVAAITDYPQRTKAQLQAQMEAKINAGEVDV